MKFWRTVSFLKICFYWASDAIVGAIRDVRIAHGSSSNSLISLKDLVGCLLFSLFFLVVLGRRLRDLQVTNNSIICTLYLLNTFLGLNFSGYIHQHQNIFWLRKRKGQSYVLNKYILWWQLSSLMAIDCRSLNIDFKKC